MGKNIGDEEASSANPDSQDGDNSEAGSEDKLSIILKEIRELREDNKRQFDEIKQEIIQTNTRMDEMGTRIATTEDRMQGAEDVITELVKQQMALQSKLIDLESRSRRENVRIYGLPEGAEGNLASSVIPFVEQLLRESLGLPVGKDLLIERAHRALAPRPPEGSSPRSMVVKFQSYRIKDEVLRLAWQKKGLTWKDKKINLDHDYAPDVLARRKEYGEIRRILKANSIRFQTLFPARLKVFLKDEIKIYGSVEEAASDLADKGVPVTRVPSPDSLVAKLQRYSWTPRQPPRRKVGFKEKLQVFRRDPIENTNV